MSRVQASVLAVLLLALGPLAAAAGGAAPAGHGTGAAVPAAAVDGAPRAARSGVDTAARDTPAIGGRGLPMAVQPGRFPAFEAADRGTVTLRITVYENASARYAFVYTRSLDNETERQRFREFADEFNTNVTPTFRDFQRGANSTVATGRNTTGREMQARSFSRRAMIGGNCVEPDSCGTVMMSFIWTNFARTVDDRLIVDDVFTGGLYLGPDKSIVFRHGPGLVFASVSPPPDSQSDPNSLADSTTVTWKGERDFANRRPRVVLAPEGSLTTPTPTPTPTPTRTTAPPGGTGPAGTATVTTTAGQPASGSGVGMWVLGGLLLLLLGGAGVFVYRRGEAPPGRGPAGAVEPDEGGPTATDSPAGTDTSADAQSGDAVAGEPAVPDEELLTDEDKVTSLLRENGGRMKQVDIVEETGWSKSKVSMLLSDMEDDDQISKLRVGRENIVSLSGHEPDAAGSPHDEE